MPHIHVIRLLRAAPTMCLTVVAILALGTGGAVAMCSLVDAVLLRPLPYRQSEELVAIHHQSARAPLAMTGLSTGTFLHYRAHNRAFQDIAGYVPKVYTLGAPGEPEPLAMALVTPNLFSVLKTVPHLGHFPTQDDSSTGGPVTVISYDLWTRRFGQDPSAIGRLLEVEDRPAGVIVGVALPGFHFPTPDTQAWIVWPQETNEARVRASLKGLYISGVARLKPAVSLHEATQDLQRLVHTLPDTFSDVDAADLARMDLRATATSLKDDIVGDIRLPLLALLATACFLLAVTWANAITLVSLRACKLQGEMAIARALGAPDRHFVWRFVSEAAALAVSGGAIGVALGGVAIALHFGLDPNAIPRLREVTPDARMVWVGAVVTLLGIALLAVPPLLASRTRSAARVLVGIGRSTGSYRERRLRSSLVIAQLALALPLTIACALTAKSFWNLTRVDLGFRSADAVTFALRVPPAGVTGDYYHGVARVHHELLERLRSQPGIEGVEAATIFPLTPIASYNNVRVARADVPPETRDAEVFALNGYATPGYFREMGIPLLSGRPFAASDLTRDGFGVIVSASLARTLFGDADPLNRRVRFGAIGTRPPATVVGVVGDVAANSIREGPSRIVYLPHVYPPVTPAVTGVISDYVPDAQVYVVRTTLPLASVATSVRATLRGINARLVPTRFAYITQKVTDSTAGTRVAMQLLLLGSGVALLLALTGVYGVLSYGAAQRTGEFSLRVALGATPALLRSLVLRQGVALGVAGTLAGLLAALPLTRYLGSQLYEVGPTDPSVITAAALFFLMTVLGASYVPARRAAKVDPARTLRGQL